MNKTERNNLPLVFLTGATGGVGKAFLGEYVNRGWKSRFRLRVLARPTKKNQKLLKPYTDRHGVEVTWGDLTSEADLHRGVKGADVALHVGGMVSPAADYYPDLTWRVNVGGMESLIKAVKQQCDPEKVRVVYTGSVSETGMRHAPKHWGRTGDPVWASKFDHYAHSKIEAERLLAESGLKHWAVLRLPGILAPNILAKGSDPITFHVPLKGVLEWVTAEDVARALIAASLLELPDKFWKGFYNVSSGPDYRLTNYDFMCRMMKAFHCPKPEKVFDARWFATDNFHGMWYEDSDELESMLHFRSGLPCDAYFAELARSMPWYVGLAPLAPAFLIKAAMKWVASRKPLGPLYWRKGHEPERLKAFFPNGEDIGRMEGWDAIDLSHPGNEPILLSHGYDENKGDEKLGLEDMEEAAAFRGGRCLSASINEGDLDTPLEWECHDGHRFSASPRLVLKGGHWCPECFGRHGGWKYDDIAAHNPFFAQVWNK